MSNMHNYVTNAEQAGREPNHECLSAPPATRCSLKCFHRKKLKIIRDLCILLFQEGKTTKICQFKICYLALAIMIKFLEQKFYLLNNDIYFGHKRIFWYYRFTQFRSKNTYHNILFVPMGFYILHVFFYSN